MQIWDEHGRALDDQVADKVIDRSYARFLAETGEIPRFTDMSGRPENYPDLWYQILSDEAERAVQ